MTQIRTVHYVPGRADCCIPMIRLTGRWLGHAGFTVSSRYRVEMLDVGSLLLRRIIDGERDERQTDGKYEAEKMEGKIGTGQGGCRSSNTPCPIPIATAPTTIPPVADSGTERTNSDGA